MDINNIQFTNLCHKNSNKKATVTSITVSSVVIVALFKNRRTKKNPRRTVLVCEIKFLYNSTVRELFPQT